MSEEEDGIKGQKRKMIDFCRRRDAEDEAKKLLASVKPNPAHDESSDYTPLEAAKAELINTTQDPTGDYALHIAALSGAYKVMDLLTGEEGVEIEPRNIQDGAYPLHRVVECAIKSLDGPEEEEMTFRSIENVRFLSQAGHNTQVRNKAKMRAIDLISEREERLLPLRLALIEAAMPAPSGKDSDVIDEDKQLETGHDSASDDD